MTLGRGIVFSTLGSLAGMVAMDLVMVLEFTLMDLPALTYLALMGSVFGGGIPAGIVAHLMLCVVMGVCFGLAVVKIRALQVGSLGKGVWLGLLAGGLTIPFGCVPFAMLIGQPLIKVLSFSTIPHLVWGLGLGTVAGLGSKGRTG